MTRRDALVGLGATVGGLGFSQDAAAKWVKNREWEPPLIAESRVGAYSLTIFASVRSEGRWKRWGWMICDLRLPGEDKRVEVGRTHKRELAVKAVTCWLRKHGISEAIDWEHLCFEKVVGLDRDPWVELQVTAGKGKWHWSGRVNGTAKDEQSAKRAADEWLRRQS